MSKVFRARFVADLRKNDIKDKVLFDALFKHNWVVYAKKPFGNPTSVVEYLGRYTHKIAISNHRIKSISKDKVSFSVKNYKKNGKKEVLTLKTEEFIRRFALHILPKGFVRMRHFGFLSTTGKRKHLKRLQKELGKAKVYIKRSEIQHLLCPRCKKGKLETVCIFSGKDPPKRWLKRLEAQNRMHKKTKY